MTAVVIVLYIVTLIVSFIYVFTKYKRKGYIFSFFNASYFFYIISLFVTGPLQYNKAAWHRIFIGDPSVFRGELNQIYIINLVGFLITTVSIYYHELIRSESLSLESIVIKISNSMSIFACTSMLVLMTVILTIILLKYNNGYLPIISGNRNFYLNRSFSFIYQTCTYGITFCSLIYIFRIMYKKRGYLILGIALLFIFGSGTRSTLINYVLYPFFLVFIYTGTRKGKGFEKNATRKIMWICIVLLIVSIWMIALRDKKVNMNYLNELIYGNTFCDIRDGAFILKFFKSKFNGKFLWGKTYLASVLSFLPSSISRYKYEWGWARFSTIKLLGWTSHTGFHAGNSTELYFNFGWLGVILGSLFKGHIFAAVEKLFYKDILIPIYEKREVNYKIIIPLWFLENLYGYFNVTSNANVIYAFLGIIILNIVFSMMTGGREVEFVH